MKVDLIDVGSGNTRSVVNWLENNDLDVNRVAIPENITANTIVLPGVGAAENMMDKLEASNFANAIRRLVHTEVKLIGICLGFQILFESTEENGGIQTLSILPGKVERIRRTISSHNGWEDFTLDLSQVSEIKHWRKHFKSRKKYLSGRCYYNHEYGVVNKMKTGVSLPISDVLSQYSGFVLTKNILAVQFHPEKSQNFGKEILECIL